MTPTLHANPSYLSISIFGDPAKDFEGGFRLLRKDESSGRQRTMFMARIKLYVHFIVRLMYSSMAG